MSSDSDGVKFTLPTDPNIKLVTRNVPIKVNGEDKYVAESVKVLPHRQPEKDRYKTDDWMFHDDAGFDVDGVAFTRINDQKVEVTSPKINGVIVLSTEILVKISEQFIDQFKGKS